MTVDEFLALPLLDRLMITSHIREDATYGAPWRKAIPAENSPNRWSIEIQCDDAPETKAAIASALQGMALDILKTQDGITSLTDPSMTHSYRVMERPRGPAAAKEIPVVVGVDRAADDDSWIPSDLFDI